MSDSQPTIMVVDDSAANLKVLQEALQAKGYRVLAFPNGKMALTAAAKSSPDLILLDIKMPGMNGFEVCECLKADGALKEIPVLFISALTETADKVKAFSMGGVDYVTKPFQFEEVHARVETHLKLRAAQREVRELLSNTLGGCIQMLLDVLEAVDPVFFKRAIRVKQEIRGLSEKLGLPGPWEVEIAAMLRRLGIVTLPRDLLVKIEKRERLNQREEGLLESVPRISHDLICKIPRMERVAQIVLYQAKNYDGTGFPHDSVAGKDIPFGARLLKIVTDLDEMEHAKGTSRTDILRGMAKLAHLYDPALMKSLLEYYKIDEKTQGSDKPSRAKGISVSQGAYKPRRAKGISVLLKNAEPGSVIAADVNSESGILVIAAGSQLTTALLARLRNYAALGHIRDSVMVEPQKSPL